MAQTKPRNRGRGRSPTKHIRGTNSAKIDNGLVDTNDDSSAEPLDEDEQKELVENLHAEAFAQSRFFQKLFGYGIGGFAAILSLTFPLLCPDECYHESTCWFHAVYASAVHCWAVHPFVVGSFASTNTYLVSGIGPRWKSYVSLTFQFAPWMIWLFGTSFAQDQDHFHVGLMIGNLVTFLGGFLIYWDMQSTNKALKDVKDAQYKHKAL